MQITEGEELYEVSSNIYYSPKVVCSLPTGTTSPDQSKALPPIKWKDPHPAHPISQLPLIYTTFKRSISQLFLVTQPSTRTRHTSTRVDSRYKALTQFHGCYCTSCLSRPQALFLFSGCLSLPVRSLL
jgi:hypothetical protein